MYNLELKDSVVISTPRDIIKLFLRGEMPITSREIRSLLRKNGLHKIIADYPFIYDIDRFNLPDSIKELPAQEKAEILELIKYFWNKIRTEIKTCLTELQTNSITLRQTDFQAPIPPIKKRDSSPKGSYTTIWAGIEGSDQVCKINHQDSGKQLGFGINITGGIHHPNIVKEQVAQLANGEIVTIAPDLTGTPTLYEMKLAQPALKLKLIIDAMLGCLNLHEKHLAHCDIKPSNILVVEETGKLSDLESLVDIDQEEIPNVITEMFNEYYYYKEEPVKIYDQKSDIFSWGITILSVLSPAIRPDFEFKNAKLSSCIWDDQCSEEYLFDLVDRIIPTSSPLEKLVKSMIKSDRETRPDLQKIIKTLFEILDQLESEQNKAPVKAKGGILG